MATKTHEPVIGDGSLHIGDRVVYPNQGICRITGVETKQIAGQNWEVVTLSRELYDNARHLLVGEIAAAVNIPLHVAEDNLDYALWPPPGMTRNGRPLPPATLGPPSPARPAAEDDDLGLEDEELVGTGEAVAPAANETDVEEEQPAPPAAHKAAADKEKSKSPHRPPKPALAKKARPAAAKKTAPAKKAAARKSAPAAKKAIPKKPAGKAKAKG